ncbi:hypothetical protein CPARK_000034900 [cyanobacterium endosymbiont of Braarudosphaera bigelowii]|uniref:Uncharacterized protein n=1 Tax=cyanobacterium endosymbiont of Braarudosphaera bigelowii TaxID=1285375 RepID=A0ABM7U493_9CHRO|nr:hypothetical protein CPARK_000034900 [cyanobacterium endosymbiont of Braarudosphaera bigelowii]
MGLINIKILTIEDLLYIYLIAILAMYLITVYKIFRLS